MTPDFLTTSNITFALGIIAILFTVYRYFKEPQVASEKKDALIEQRMRYQLESNEQRFKDIQGNFTSLLLQSNNHIHTIDVKTDKLSENIQQMSIQVTRFGTIMEERLPKK